jgi:hypothetical protein
MAANCYYKLKLHEDTQNTCTNPNLPCPYQHYLNSFNSCYYSGSGGDYKNCINKNTTAVSQLVVDGDCDGTNCTGGISLPSYLTNNVVAVDYKSGCSE